MPGHYELFAIIPHEADWGVAGMPRVVECRKLMATGETTDVLVRHAAADAAEKNYGDGDYRVQDGGGREVARVQVRAGVARLIAVAGGRTAAEELEDLKDECSFCGERYILTPCRACGRGRCAHCLPVRVCCVPSTPRQED